MKYLTVTFLLLFLSVKIYSQTNRNNIRGKVFNDTISIKNVHIINKNSGMATISNAFGEFIIPVKRNDTLIFSAIQLRYKEIIINLSHINRKELQVHLKTKINKLNEIIIKNHNLSGNLKKDMKNVVQKYRVDEFTLNLPNAGKKPTTEIDHIKLRYNQYSGPIGLLYGWLSGDKKNLKKLEKLETERLVLDKIRNLIKDQYFIHTLKIPKDSISHFLTFCIPKRIIELYNQNKKNELIDILIYESKGYKK